MADEQARELKDLVAAAQAGDARAQFELGRRHYHGTDAPKDLAAAARWFRRAAAQHHLVARIYLTELTGEEDRQARNADGNFDRWLHNAMEALRRPDAKRREASADLQPPAVDPHPPVPVPLPDPPVAKAAEPGGTSALQRWQTRLALPALALAIAALSAVLWWWRYGSL